MCIPASSIHSHLSIHSCWPVPPSITTCPSLYHHLSLPPSPPVHSSFPTCPFLHPHLSIPPSPPVPYSIPTCPFIHHHLSLPQYPPVIPTNVVYVCLIPYLFRSNLHNLFLLSINELGMFRSLGFHYCGGLSTDSTGRLCHY